MKSAWQKTREDRILVDHMLRQGHYSAASKLAQISGTEVYIYIHLSLVCENELVVFLPGPFGINPPPPPPPPPFTISIQILFILYCQEHTLPFCSNDFQGSHQGQGDSVIYGEWGTHGSSLKEHCHYHTIP